MNKLNINNEKYTSIGSRISWTVALDVGQRRIDGGLPAGDRENISNDDRHETPRHLQTIFLSQMIDKGQNILRPFPFVVNKQFRGPLEKEEELLIVFE